MKLIQWINDIKRFIQYGDLPTSYYVKRGMKVGKNFGRQSGTRLDPSNCWLIEIGDDVGMGNKSQILAHDFSMTRYTGYARFGRVTIGDRVNIGANVTILLNVHIGNDVIIGAGSLVASDIPDGVVVSGVPAKIVCKTKHFVNFHQPPTDFPLFTKADTNYDGNKLTAAKKAEMLKAMDQSPDGILHIKFQNDHLMIGNDKRVPV